MIGGLWLFPVPQRFVIDINNWASCVVIDTPQRLDALGGHGVCARPHTENRVGLNPIKASEVISIPVIHDGLLLPSQTVENSLVLDFR